MGTVNWHDVWSAIVFFGALRVSLAVALRFLALASDDVKVNGESPRIEGWRMYLCAALWAVFLYSRI
jgi:hypothetical protein